MRLWGAVAGIAGRRAGIRGSGAGLLRVMGAVIGCSVAAIMIVAVLRIVGRIVRLGIRRVGAVAEGAPLLLGRVAYGIQGMESEKERSRSLVCMNSSCNFATTLRIAGELSNQCLSSPLFQRNLLPPRRFPRLLLGVL
jgi:hypothetical protein